MLLALGSTVESSYSQIEPCRKRKMGTQVKVINEKEKLSALQTDN